MVNEVMPPVAVSQEQKVPTDFDGPIPGQSLTNNPEAPQPFEQPPEFTALHPACEEIWGQLIEPEIYMQSMRLLNEGIPVMDLVKGLLFMGFQNGKWNPDLMVMLMEPTAYMFIALAERQDIPFVVYHNEDDDDIAQEEILGTAFDEEKIKDIKNAARNSNVPEGILTKQMQSDLENLPELNLEETTIGVELAPENNQESLMSRPEQ
jgi:hypothetical protein